jgi:hypothetical protein
MGGVVKKPICVVVLCALVEASCVATPPLSQATGSAQSNIMIRDVVLRVKCELSEAFDEKTRQPEFLWLANWTAHADLTLTINDNAGISPSGSYTRFQQNAVNLDAGPSSFPATASRGVVNQFFSVSVGAALSGQAVRTETVSFTVALDELRLWRKRLDMIESDPNFPQEKKLCNFGLAAGVTGNLGLKEWVDSAFFPVELGHFPDGQGQLQAGVHSAGTSKAPSVSAPQPGTTGPKAAADKLTVGEALKKIKDWQATLVSLNTETKTNSGAIDSGKTSVPNAQNSIREKIKSAAQYRYVLAPYLKERYSQVSYLIDQYLKDLTKCVSIQQDITDASSRATRLYDSLKDLKDPNQFVSSINTPGFDLKAFTNDYNALENQIVSFQLDETGKPTSDIKKSQYTVALAKCAKVVQAAVDLPNKLPQQVDPPIDAVLHSLTFVINYGANVTPSWTLLQWKGPGQSANFASAAGVRTHGLVISMGPRTGSPAIGDDPIRLIQLQAIRSINQQ